MRIVDWGLTKMMASLKARLGNDDMLVHGAMMIGFGLLANFFDYIYQFSMSRMLSAEDYGTFSSLYSTFVVVFVLSGTVGITMTKFCSTLKVSGGFARLNYFWQTWLKRMLILGIVTFVVAASLSPLISDFLNIDNVWYPITLFSAFVLVFALPVNYGILRGLQRFRSLGLSTALFSFLAAGLAMGLVYLGLGVCGGLASPVIAYSITLGVTFLLLRGLGKAGKEQFEASRIFSYAGFAMVAILSFAVVINIDVFLAKHYLSSEAAGDYSATSVLGKIALYAPMGVAVAMFPKTSDLYEAGLEHRAVVIRAIALTCVVGLAVVAVYAVFPGFISDVLLGGKYQLSSANLVKYGLAMFLFALSSLLMNYALSMSKTAVAWPLLAAAVLEIVLIVVFHSSIDQIVNVMLVSASSCLFLMVAWYLVRRLRRAPSH